MKFIIAILLSIVACVGVSAKTENDSLRQATVIVEGLFFDKSVPPKSLVPGNSTLAMLKDPDGNSVIGIYLPDGYEMEESVKAKAIPAEQVRHAARLLRDYNGRRPRNVAAYQGIGVKVGEPFIKFEYADTDDKVWNNEILKGKIYVINVWQTECGPCRREMPILSEWKERFPDVVFLSASRHNTEEILPIAAQHNFTWTHLQEAADIVSLVGAEGFPLTIIVDRDGIVRYAKVGATPENQSAAVALLSTLTP